MAAKTVVVKGILPSKDGACLPKENCDCSLEELLPISCNNTTNDSKKIPVISCDNQTYRLEDLTQLVEAIIASSSIISPPVGSIIPFDEDITTPGPNFDSTGLGIGSCIGWALCNGSNGTPDLITNNRGILSSGGVVPHQSFLGQNSITLTGPQSGIQAHSVTITDPGHSHGATQAAHSHNFTGTPHSHTVTDTGHTHTGTAAAHTHTVNDSGHTHSVTDPGHIHQYDSPAATTFSGGAVLASGDPIGAVANTDSAITGITIASATTGITLANATPALSIDSATTGVTIANATAGGTLDNATPAITVNSNTTGITASVSAASATSPIDLRSASYALGFIKRLF